MSRSIRLGAFILITLLIFGGGVFWIGRLQTRFRSTYRLNAEFQNVAGLDNGAEVRVGGIHKGTVRSIALPARPDEKVRVVMDLQKDTRGVIRKDSIAAIHSEGLVGDRFVEISFGSDQAASVSNNDTIQSEPSIQVSDMLKKVDAILDSTRSAMENFSSTTSNLKSISSKVNRGQGTAGALVNDKELYVHLDAAVSALEEDVEALKHNFLLRGFFNKRGYEDPSDLKRNEISRLPTGAPLKQFNYGVDKLFGKKNSAKLKNDQQLNAAGKYLEENSFGLTVIAARSGMKGDSDEDRKLCESRAVVVREYLVDHFGLDDERIKTIAIGKNPDTGEEGRVDILVYPAERTNR